MMVMTKNRNRREEPRVEAEVDFWRKEPYLYFKRIYSDGTMAIKKRHIATGEVSDAGILPADMVGLDRIASLPNEIDQLLERCAALSEEDDMSIGEKAIELGLLNRLVAILGAKLEAEAKADRKPEIRRELNIALTKANSSQRFLLRVAMSIIRSVIPLKGITVPNGVKEQSEREVALTRAIQTLDKLTVHFKVLEKPWSDGEMDKARAAISAYKDLLRHMVEDFMNDKLSPVEQSLTLTAMSRTLTFAAIMAQGQNSVSKRSALYESIKDYCAGKAQYSLFEQALDEP